MSTNRAMNPSPRKIFIDNIAPSILSQKKEQLLKVWEEHVVPQIESGKIKFKASFDFVEYLDSIKSILDFPIHKRIDRIELELMTHLDLFPEIEKKIFKNADDIFVTALSSHRVNARVIQCSNRNFMILLNEGLINFIRAVTSWCISLINTQDDKDALVLINSLREKARFYLNSYKQKLVLIEDFSLQPTHEEIFLINKITNNSLKFAMAHEYGHIANDDFLKGKRQSESFAGHRMNVCVKSREREFKADEFAFNLLHKINKSFLPKIELEYLVSGILVLFLAMDLLEFVTEQEDDFNSHPSANTRGEKLMNSINEKLGDHLDLPVQIEDAFIRIFNDFSLTDKEETI